MTATHCSGAPFPLPIRVSAGFLVIGLSGNRRIQTLPPRLIERVMATRAASICRSVIQPHSMAFNPNSPNEIEEPRHAFPAIRPRCCLRYLTFFGIIMAVIPYSRASPAPAPRRPEPPSFAETSTAEESGSQAGSRGAAHHPEAPVLRHLQPAPGADRRDHAGDHYRGRDRRGRAARRAPGAARALEADRAASSDREFHPYKSSTSLRSRRTSCG